MSLSREAETPPFTRLGPTDPVPGTKIEQYRDWLRFWFYEDRGLAQVHCIDKWLPCWAKDRYWKHERQPPYVVQSKSTALTRLHRKVLQLHEAGLSHEAIGTRVRLCRQRVGQVLAQARVCLAQFAPAASVGVGAGFVQSTGNPGELTFPALGKTIRLVEWRGDL